MSRAVALEGSQSRLCAGEEGLRHAPRHKGGGRAKAIHLTASARQEAEAIRHFATGVRERVLHDVDERDLVTDMHVLLEVARNLGAAS